MQGCQIRSPITHTKHVTGLSQRSGQARFLLAHATFTLQVNWSGFDFQVSFRHISGSHNWKRLHLDTWRRGDRDVCFSKGRSRGYGYLQCNVGEEMAWVPDIVSQVGCGGTRQFDQDFSSSRAILYPQGQPLLQATNSIPMFLLCTRQVSFKSDCSAFFQVIFSILGSDPQLLRAEGFLISTRLSSMPSSSFETNPARPDRTVLN